MRILSTIHSEGFVSEIREDTDGRVFFKGDGDIDADGCNGQNGFPAAYMVGDRGSEALANGGMAIRNGKVVGIKSWFSDIVITDSEGNPRVFPGGIIASKTAYRLPGFISTEPDGYIDGEKVPYIVVPPVIIQRTIGAVLGCRARVTHITSGSWVDCGVFDVGPRDKIGELSPAAARVLGINPNPRRGGEDRPLLQYELWPGKPYDSGDHRYVLQTSSGHYITL